MQPSRPAPTGSKWFGPAGNFGGPIQRGVITYQVSPFQQKPMANAMKKGLFNVFRRTSQQLPYLVPAFILFYVVVDHGNKEHARMATKAYQQEHGHPE